MTTTTTTKTKDTTTVPPRPNVIVHDKDCFLENAIGSYYTCATLRVIDDRHDETKQQEQQRQRQLYHHRMVPQCTEWQVYVGQTIAVATTTDTDVNDTITTVTTPPPYLSNHNNNNNPWYPFQVPWKPAQILAIYEPSLSYDDDDNNDIMMTVRWFSWSHTNTEDVGIRTAASSSSSEFQQQNQQLPDGHPIGHYEVLEHYSVATNLSIYHHALGRLCLSSTLPTTNQPTVDYSYDGMPCMDVTCRYAICRKSKETQSSDIIQRISDWTNDNNNCNNIMMPTTSAFQRALSLLLLLDDDDVSSNAKRGCHLLLQRETMDAMKPLLLNQSTTTMDHDNENMNNHHHDHDDDFATSTTSTTPQSSSSSTSSSVIDLQSSSSTSSSSSCFYRNDNVSYYWKLSIPTQPQVYDKNINIDINIQNERYNYWTVHVGDLIAVQHDGSSEPTTSSYYCRSDHRRRPAKKKNKTNKRATDRQRQRPWFPFTVPWSPAQVLALSYNDVDGYMVHVRWLYRRNDFLNSEEKEVTCIEDLVLQRQQHESRGTKKSNNETDKFIVYEVNVYNVEDVSSVLGRVILTSEGRPPKTFFYNNVCNNNNEDDDEGIIPQAPLICRSMITDDCQSVIPITDWKRSHTCNRRQLLRGLECCLEDDPDLRAATLSMFDDDANTKDAAAADEFDEIEISALRRCRRSERNNVSVTEESSDVFTEDDARMTTNEGRRERPTKQQQQQQGTKRPSSESTPSESSQSQNNEVVLVDDSSEEDVSMDEDNDDTEPDKSVNSPISPMRPSKRRRVRPRRHTKSPPSSSGTGLRRSARNRVAAVHRERLEKTIDTFVQKGCDDRCEEKRSAASPHSIQSDCTDSSSESKVDRDDERIFIPSGIRPFHEDVASLRSYYSEIRIVPDRERIEVSCPPDPKKEPWTVKLGDTVAVTYRQGAGSTFFGFANGGIHSPFNEPWAVAEVVAIWKEHESTSAMDKSGGRCNQDPQEDVMIEIRWFYRKNELPGSAKSLSNSENAARHCEYEEIVETDLMDECSALCLIAPVIVHESPPRLGPPTYRHEMPVVEFYCSRFWSIHRKSLVPCGSMSGRVKRARMHSKYFGNGGALHTACRECEDVTPREPLPEEPIVSPNKWKQAFVKVIDNLGLSAASEEASVRGMKLTGREAEQEKIMTFLRSRICGTVVQGGSAESPIATNASLFVAGPPGTGKTATVHSVIARLRKEQAKGELPAFDFVSLNGMEMRHPFEAYVKFWEIISGNEKQKCPPEIAVAKLERYFARGSRDEEGNKSSQVVVLLLDEIDYLVTKKQTVLYNFFDWPRRACENEYGPRLIVVGISNTLNLPSRLKPSVQSRLGNEMCGYKSYNVKDMVTILKSKVQQDAPNAYRVFEDDAIQFAARKTAALSGDIRKALHICKVAADTVLKEVENGTRIDPKNGGTAPIVRISDVQKASRESFSSILSKAVAFSTSFEALLLVSLASLTQSTGRHDGGFDINELISKMQAISGGSGDVQYSPPPTFGETLEILNRLGETRLVSLHTPKSSNVTFRAAQGGSGGAWPLISLPMDSSNLRKALRDTPHNTLANKYLGSY